MAENVEQDQIIELTAEIVSAYVSNNNVASGDLPSLIKDVHLALNRTAGGISDPAPEPLKPAISVRKSVTPDFIICLEDGKRFKSLKRHLRTHYDLTPDEYREKWGSPPIIRWWRRTTPRRAPAWRRRWASGRSGPRADAIRRLRGRREAQPRSATLPAVSANHERRKAESLSRSAR